MDTNAPVEANTIKKNRGTFVDFFLIAAAFAILSLAAILGFLLILHPHSTAIPQDISLPLPTNDGSSPISVLNVG